VATPTVDYPKDKTHRRVRPALSNNKLLAADFARNGFQVSAQAVRRRARSPSQPLLFDLKAWIGCHGQEQTRPIVDSVVAALREEGITVLATTGYCFGVRYVADLPTHAVTKVSAVSHPSRLAIPDDLTKYHAVAKAPLLINSCTVDEQSPLAAPAQADKIFGSGKF
ncbi:hypothetical protein GGX14DRAFT_672825, partial [Mycena pura]